MNFQNRSLLTEGVILAVTSAYVYLATFLYEYGFCAYFDIPATLINPNLSTILVAAAAVGGIFLSSLKLLGLSAPLLRAAADPARSAYREFFGVNAIWLILGILLVTIYGISLKLLIFVGVFAVYELVYFGPVFLFDRNKPLRDRFEHHSSAPPDQLDLPILFVEWFGRGWLVPIMLLGALLLVAYLAGQGEAIRKEQFLVPEWAPNVVVLKQYNDLFIGARFKRAKHRLTNELLLMRIGHKELAEFRNEVIGPLEPWKPRSSKRQNSDNLTRQNPVSTARSSCVEDSSQVR